MDNTTNEQSVAVAGCARCDAVMTSWHAVRKGEGSAARNVLICRKCFDEICGERAAAVELEGAPEKRENAFAEAPGYVLPLDSERRDEAGTRSGLVGAGGVSVLKSGQTSFLNSRVLSWFSCGAPSACASKLAAEEYGFGPKVARVTLEIVNCDTLIEEHEDNARFMREVAEWIGWPVKQIRSSLYSTVDQVNVGTRYMAGPDGARCTTELKKKPRLAYQWAEDLHIWGLAADEEKRIKEFEFNNPDLRCQWILREAGMTTSDCHEMIKRAGIRLPAMYELGYEHNNCIGCLKATSPKYWNQIRRDFPAKFALRARRSRELGVRLVRLNGVRIFLDELPSDTVEEVKEDLSCGPACNPESVAGGGGAEPVRTSAATEPKGHNVVLDRTPKE